MLQVYMHPKSPFLRGAEPVKSDGATWFYFEKSDDIGFELSPALHKAFVAYESKISIDDQCNIAVNGVRIKGKGTERCCLTEGLMENLRFAYFASSKFVEQPVIVFTDEQPNDLYQLVAEIDIL